MKTFLFALFLALAWTSSGQAQQIYAQSFPRGLQTNASVGFTINLTTPGPLDIMATAGPAPTTATAATMSVTIDGGPANGGYYYSVASSTLAYVSGTLSPGSHSVAVFASYSISDFPSGTALVIAPNEPGNG